jgi:dihydrofolate synthase / folylpolyglutamate synthase
MNYQQTIAYLFDQLPMFHRIGAAAYKANLDNTHQLCRILDHPELKFKSIHIAGTNGKGSVSNMVAAILQTAGYKTGLYTSPHLTDFRERIRINGKKIPESKVIEFVENYKKPFESIQPSFFEYTFGMAVKYFADEKVDIAVMETGMGGRLDSTNVVNSILSVITNIGYDHTQFLGDTLEKIAIEKAGIFKPSVPCLIGETQREIVPVFHKVAGTSRTPLIFADQNFSVTNLGSHGVDNPFLSMNILKSGKPYLTDLKCSLTGKYQFKNIITSMQVFEILQNLGFPLKSEDIYSGMENINHLTEFKGRWQILGKEPLIICDTGHNLDGISEVVSQIKTISCKSMHIVLGFVKDKEIDKILRILPQEAEYYFCKANIPRAMDQANLKLIANNAGLKGNSYPSVMEALLAAKNKAGNEDLIFIGGSTFVVAEIL